MTVLTFADQDGDPVAVESTEIAGLSVGDLSGPRKAGADARVTLIWLRGNGQPFMVAVPFSDVLHRWTESRGESLALKAHPKAYPLVQHQYPSGAPT